MKENKTGKIIWSDLTVDRADEIRDFYNQVVGWKYESVQQGGYADYNMMNNEGEIAAGICHRKGGNINLPSQWLIYITVENISESIENCKKLGGKVIDGPRKIGNQQFVVIQDPAGAYIALFQE